MPQELKLLFWPDERLKKPTTGYNLTSTELRDVFNQMAVIMYDNDGYGLSATQVGLSCNLFVMRDPEQRDQAKLFLNPCVVGVEGDKWLAKEGCLSVPGMKVAIRRPETVILDYYTFDKKGNLKSSVAERFHQWDARCILHEIDHLNGTMIFDHINSNLGLRVFMDKYRKAKIQYDRIHG